MPFCRICTFTVVYYVLPLERCYYVPTRLVFYIAFTFGCVRLVTRLFIYTDYPVVVCCLRFRYVYRSVCVYVCVAFVCRGYVTVGCVTVLILHLRILRSFTDCCSHTLLILRLISLRLPTLLPVTFTFAVGFTLVYAFVAARGYVHTRCTFAFDYVLRFVYFVRLRYGFMHGYTGCVYARVYLPPRARSRTRFGYRFTFTAIPHAHVALPRFYVYGYVHVTVVYARSAGSFPTSTFDFTLPSFTVTSLHVTTFTGCAFTFVRSGSFTRLFGFIYRCVGYLAPVGYVPRYGLYVWLRLRLPLRWLCHSCSTTTLRLLRCSFIYPTLFVYVDLPAFCRLIYVRLIPPAVGWFPVATYALRLDFACVTVWVPRVAVYAFAHAFFTRLHTYHVACCVPLPRVTTCVYPGCGSFVHVPVTLIYGC